MSKFEMLCSLLPAEINWGDPITPQMVEGLVATEREAIVSLAAEQGWAMKNEDPFEDAVRDICTMRSNNQVQRDAACGGSAGTQGSTAPEPSLGD